MTLLEAFRQILERLHDLNAKEVAELPVELREIAARHGEARLMMCDLMWLLVYEIAEYTGQPIDTRTFLRQANNVAGGLDHERDDVDARMVTLRELLSQEVGHA